MDHRSEVCELCKPTPSAEYNTSSHVYSTAIPWPWPRMLPNEVHFCQFIGDWKINRNLCFARNTYWKSKMRIHVSFVQNKIINGLNKYTDLRNMMGLKNRFMSLCEFVNKRYSEKDVCAWQNFLRFLTLSVLFLLFTSIRTAHTETVIWCKER